MLAYAYTNDEGVAAMAALTVPVYVLWSTSDTTAFLGGCTLRGAGKQSVGAAISLLNTYFVGVPAAFYLALYTTLGVRGLWLGMFCGQNVACALQAAFLFCKMDWGREAKEARKRALASPESKS